jgi:hypothetical protein
MRNKLAIGALAVSVGFLLATNPVVSEAAGQVTGKQIKNNSVTGKDIKDGKVSGADVADGSLEGTDVKDGSLAGGDLAAGSVGGAQISDGSVGLGDLAGGAVSELKQPRAYGVFRSNGTLVPARSKNVTVTKIAVGLGVYCVTPTAASGIDPVTTSIIATPDFNDGGGAFHIVQQVSATLATAPTDCPGGYELVTDNFTGGTFVRTDIAVSFVIP